MFGLCAQRLTIYLLIAAESLALLQHDPRFTPFQELFPVNTKCDFPKLRFDPPVHNNLGGLGPGTGPEELYFESVFRHAGKDYGLKATTVGTYTPNRPSNNGLKGEFMQVNLAIPSDVTLRFQIVDSAGNPAVIPKFGMQVADIDFTPKNRDAIESVRVWDLHDFILPGSGGRIVATPGRGYMDFRASDPGTGDDNPEVVNEFTPHMKRNSVIVIFKDTSEFRMNMRVGEGTGPGRNFFFGPVDFADCPCFFPEFDLDDLVHNNLGGQGPKLDDPEEMLFRSILVHEGDPVDMRITTVSEYDPFMVSQNRMNGAFLQINMRQNETTRIQIDLINSLGLPVVLPYFAITVYDLDMTPKNRDSVERVSAFSVGGFRVTDPTNVIVREGQGLERWDFFAGAGGTGADNPHDPFDLTEQQKRNSVVLGYLNTATFQLGLRVGPGKSPGRNFLFGTVSELACFDGE